MYLLRIVLLALATVTAVAADGLPGEMTLEALPQTVPAPLDNVGSPAKVALGRLLFFDPVLSATKTVACATCHYPTMGWSDGRAVPIGAGGNGIGPRRTVAAGTGLPLLQRNTLSLLNVAFNGMVSGTAYDPANAPMFWDSRLSGLEAQALVPLRSREEMRGDVCAEAEALPFAVERVMAVMEYRERFAKVFFGPVTSVKLAMALAAFERTLVSCNTRFDRFMRGDKGAMDEQQQRGMKVFREAGCMHCHGGPMFSDFKPHVIGVSDAIGIGRRGFRTPTLRNLKHSAPYMHNGTMKSLDDVLAFYEQLGDAASESLDGADQSAQPPFDPFLQKLNLRPEDFPALRAFFDALDDDGYDQRVPARVPSGLPVAGGRP
ncbi:MAG: hypothetical protein JWO08_2550 [Verrucomicrobiaceae bacterium]|nr:hypothetical protein [Verrucomicrobiaceae bacterium]